MDLCDWDERLESEPVRTESTDTSRLESVGRELVPWSTEAEEARLEAVKPSPTLFVEELRGAEESTLVTRELRADAAGGLP